MSKIKKPNKKFYDKWIYKITLNLKGCGILRDNSLASVKEKCVTNSLKSTYYHERTAIGNEENLIKICEILLKYDRSLWQKRIEYANIDIYTNTISLIDDLVSDLQSIVIQKFQVETDNINSKIILTNKLPHEKFKFKVYLKPHILKSDKEEKTKYLNWLKNQKNIMISEAVENWFLKTDYNWDPRYIWVQDDQTLMMLKLRNSEVCGRVYEYSVR